MNYPSGLPNPEYPFEEESEDNSISTKFEDGTVQSRLKFTKSRKTWTLTWGKMPQAKFTTLDSFIVGQAKHSANVFNWTNPANNTVYSVRCVGYTKKMVEVDNWQVELKLQEA